MAFGAFDIQQWEKARQSDVRYEGNTNQEVDVHAVLNERQAMPP